MVTCQPCTLQNPTRIIENYSEYVQILLEKSVHKLSLRFMQMVVKSCFRNFEKLSLSFTFDTISFSQFLQNRYCILDISDNDPKSFPSTLEQHSVSEAQGEWTRICWQFSNIAHHKVDYCSLGLRKRGAHQYLSSRDVIEFSFLFSEASRISTRTLARCVCVAFSLIVQRCDRS